MNTGKSLDSFLCVAVKALLFQPGTVGTRLSVPAWGHRSPLKTTLLSFYWCAHASYFALNGASEGQQLTNWTKSCNSPSPLLFWRIEGDALKPTSLLFLNTSSCPLHSLTCAWSAVRQKVLILVTGPQKDPTGQNDELTRDLYIALFHPTPGCR